MTEHPTHEEKSAAAVTSMLIETFYAYLRHRDFVGLGEAPKRVTGESPVSFSIDDPNGSYRWTVEVRFERI